MVTKEYYTVRVKSGEHQGQHRTYHTGDVFRTQYPLHKMFTNKFELLPNAPAPIEGGPDTISTVLNAQNAKADRTDQQSGAIRTAPVPPAEMSPYGEYAPNTQGAQFSPETYDFVSAKKVTNQFKGAKAMGLEVWNSASDGFAVSEAGAKVPMNLAPNAMSTKQEVKEYLDSMRSPEIPD